MDQLNKYNIVDNLFNNCADAIAEGDIQAIWEFVKETYIKQNPSIYSSENGKLLSKILINLFSNISSASDFPACTFLPFNVYLMGCAKYGVKDLNVNLDEVGDSFSYTASEEIHFNSITLTSRAFASLASRKIYTGGNCFFKHVILNASGCSLATYDWALGGENITVVGNIHKLYCYESKPGLKEFKPLNRETKINTLTFSNNASGCPAYVDLPLLEDIQEIYLSPAQSPVVFPLWMKYVMSKQNAATVFKPADLKMRAPKADIALIKAHLKNF